MTESFNSLTILLKLLSPNSAPDETFELLSQIAPEQWDALIAEAERQEVAPLLFALLADLHKSHGREIPQKEKLRQTYLSTAARNMLTLHDAELVFAALRKAGIPVAGLKGVYLLEHAYPDIAARSMSDIDILIRKRDLAECIRILEGLGYRTTGYFNLDDENVDTKHVPPMEKSGGAIVELHWTLLEEDEPFTIDAQALWQRTVPARIANVDALALGVEDLILHLCLHLTYQHYLNLGLRGLLDIALVIHKFRPEIDWQKLIQIAQSWGAERVTLLALKLVETQLKVPIPAEVVNSLLPEGIPSSLLEQARSQLLGRERFGDQLTPDLVKMNTSRNLISKIKIGFQRIFIPRLALARLNNVPPTSPKIYGLYWVRLPYLIRTYGGTLNRLRNKDKTTGPALQKAESSYALHDWMSPDKK